MVKVKRSEYIRISRTAVKKLFDQNCFGKGSVYIHVLKSGISKEDLDKVEIVLEALIKQNICCKKKKETNASELVRTRSQLPGVFCSVASEAFIVVGFSKENKLN